MQQEIIGLKSGNLHKIWSISLFLYLICSMTFLAGPYVFINSISLYLFLLVSGFNILLNKRIRINWVIISLILYGAFCIVSIIWSPASLGQSSSVLYDYITMIVVVICVYNYLKRAEDIDFVLFGLMFGGACLSIYVFILYGPSYFENINTSTYIRVGSELANANTVGLLAAFSSLTACYFLLYHKKPAPKKILYLIILIITVCMALLSGSKKAYVIVISGIFFLFALNPRSKFSALKKLATFIIAVVLVFIFIYLINSVDIFHTVKDRLINLWNAIQNQGGSESDFLRIYYTQKGLELFLQRPLEGNGFAASYVNFGTYSHDNFVEILMNTGIIGFMLFYFPYLSIIRNIFKSRSKANPQFLILAIIFFLIIINSVGMVYYFDRTTQIWICLVGFYFLNYKKDEQNTIGRNALSL